MEKKLLRRQVITMLLCVALTLIAFGLANAADYYVTPTGAGSNSGADWANAGKSIQLGINACCAGGGTVHVGNGTYNTTNDTFPLAISSCTGVYLKGYGANYQGPKIDAGGTGRVIQIDNSSSKIVVENFLITGGNFAGDGGGIYVLNSSDILLKNLEVTNNTCTGGNGGGGMALDNSIVGVIGCCVWKNYAVKDANGYGGYGAGIELLNPGAPGFGRGYWIRDCCIFLNEADLGGGGIALSGDDGYSVIENNLIRQNCINTSGDMGAGIHCDCAKTYVRDNTVADNYYCADAVGHGGPPQWGLFPDGSTPTTDVYGIWGCKSQGFWMKGIHNIVYFNGPPTFDDWNKWSTVTVEYSDVDMVTTSPYPGVGNMNANPLFTGKVDQSRPCNSTFYFLSLNSPCIDAGIAKSADPWEAGATHCSLVNTLSGTCDKGTYYSVRKDGLADLDRYCDDASCTPGEGIYKIDLGYHYDHKGMNYIELESFSANVHTDKVVLKWETGTEIDNAGFLVYRCANEASNCTKISDFIAANGDAVGGATYSFTDANVVPGAGYYYYLVDINTSGEWTAHGPVFARIPNIAEPLRLQKLEPIVR